MKKYLFFLPVLLLTVILSPVTSHAADTWSGGFSSVNPIYYNVHTNDTYKNNYIVPAARNWNGISSKVTLSNWQNSAAAIEVYAETTSDPDLLGEFIPYYTDNFGRHRDTSCYCHTWNGGGDLIGYYDNMNKNNMTDSQIISNYTHEFGHSLSLGHPSESSASVMHQGIQSIGPQSLDKSNLRKRWGY
ncbi:hypothetical protein [Tuberibacillus calidus]|jgi:predicted Zn-dependent protease|uniref:hypothetical protein n=1 Tax=Tuberibacillus calidus TaxID=340097 RepID=UPI000684CD11|nr:hypothetical protein [Tuberibacillus calidus]